MDLQHDESGFLTGDIIDLGDGRAVLLAIHADVRAIRNIIKARSRAGNGGGDNDFNGSPPGRPRRSGPTPDIIIIRAGDGPGARPPRRDDIGNRIVPPPSIIIPVPPRRNRQDRPGGGQNNPPGAPLRGPDGRFIRRNPDGSPDTSGSNDSSNGGSPGRGPDGRFTGGAGGSGGSDPEERHRVADMMRWLKESISGAGIDGAEDVDPMIKAYQEVATPIKSVLGMAGSLASFGSGDDKESKFFARWYRKIFGELRLFRREEEEASSETNDLLEDIEENSDGGGGGSRSGIGGFFTAIAIGFFGLLIGALTKLARIVPIVARLFGRFGSAISRLGGGLAGFLKRIPVLGTLFAGALAAFDIHDSETDASLTRREKDQRAGTAVGGLAGSIAGMIAGASAGAVLGPIGSAVGGIIGGFLGNKAGKIIGDTVGGWVNDLRNSDIPGKLAGIWNSIADHIMSGWDSVTDAWHGIVDGTAKGWKAISDTVSIIVNGIDDFLSDVFGFSLPGKDDVDKAIDSSLEYLSKNTIFGQLFSGVIGLFGDDEPVNNPVPQSVQPVLAPAVEVTKPVVARAPTPQSAPTSPPPEQRTKINSSQPQNINVSVRNPDAGQDVRDRSIAHVVSGGIAG